MYSNIITTGEYVWALSLGVFSGNDGVDAGSSNANIDEVDLKEEDDHLEKDGIPNFKNDISWMVGGSICRATTTLGVVTNERK